jgi:two-component system NarL family sensor kinase
VFRKRIIFIVLLTGIFSVSSQTKELDSLRRALNNYEARQKKNGITSLSKADTIKAQLLSAIAITYYYADPQQSGFFAERQLDIAQKINYKYGMAVAHNTLGSLADQKGNFKSALSHYEKSLRLRDNDDKTGQIDCYINIGILYGKQNDYSKALHYQFKGLTIAKEINDDFGIAGIYNNIGVLYVSTGKYDEALKNYLASLSAFRRLGNLPEIAVACQNVGDAYLYLNAPDNAKIYYDEGLAISRKVGYPDGEAYNLHGLGKLYYKKGRYEDAIENFDLALRLRQRSEDFYGAADASIALGRTYWKVGKIKQAINLIENGYQSARQGNVIDLQYDAISTLSEIFSAQGDYRKAFEYERQSKALADSILNIEKEKQFNQLQLKYDLKTAQDSLKIAQEKKDARLNEEAQQQRNTRNIIYTALCLTVIFLIILIWQRSKIAKEKRRRALEEERNRISRELHDNLGAQLSTVRMFLRNANDNKSGQAIADVMNRSIGMIDSSINDLQNVMQEMQDPILIEKGYFAAAEALVNSVRAGHNIEFCLMQHKADETIDTNTGHQLYRITQELVNNTLKYADAKNVTLELLRRDDALVLMYEDDGKGYDLETARRGYGLRNIEARAASVGGRAEFDSMPGSGARTIIEIPI